MDLENFLRSKTPFTPPLSLQVTRSACRNFLIPHALCCHFCSYGDYLLVDCLAAYMAPWCELKAVLPVASCRRWA